MIYLFLIVSSYSFPAMEGQRSSLAHEIEAISCVLFIIPVDDLVLCVEETKIKNNKYRLSCGISGTHHIEENLVNKICP